MKFENKKKSWGFIHKMNNKIPFWILQKYKWDVFCLSQSEAL